jgi:putative inorganic carbon (hco3(-)) transporter
MPVERAAVAGAVALSALLFVPPLGEPFNAPKLALVLLAAGLAALAGARTRVRLGPDGRRFGVAVLAFLAVAAVATAAHPFPLRAVMGLAGRSSGFALALACGLLAWSAARVCSASSSLVLAGTLAGAAVLTMAYGVVQLAGVDPFAWRVLTRGPQLFSTFGNNNFFAGWLGAASALLLAAALARLPLGLRVAAGAAWLLAVGLVVATTSAQGIGAALVAAGVVSGVRLGQARTRPSGRAVAAGALALAVGVAVVGAVGLFDGLTASLARSLHTRVWQWQAAVGMAAERPLTGVGYDAFVDWVHLHRPVWWALERGIHPTTDAAHSVPLQLLAGGGLPLLAAYAGVVATTGMALVRGLRRLRGDEQLLLAALGGVWAGYQVQSLVSIDVPPLAVLHWVLAGAIVGTAVRGTDEAVTLPRAGPRRPAALLTAAVVCSGAVAVAGVVVWAGMTQGRAARLDADHQVAAAGAAYERAVRIARWDPDAALALGRHRSERGDHEGALDAYRLAVARQPRGITQQVELARLASRRGRDDLAATAYAAAVAIDPHAPVLRAEVAGHAASTGRPQEALDHLRAAVAVEPEMAAWWELLADVLAQVGESEAAQQAQARARDADPELSPPEDSLHEPRPGVPALGS